MDFEIKMHDLENSTDAKGILQELTAYNVPFTGPRDYRELTLTVRGQDGRLKAGLTGWTQWQWLFVKMFWVSESFRGQGAGARILAAAEAEAKARGCRGVWLDTFSFQAPGFYEKQGYRRFGEIENYPDGHTRFFYKKTF